MTARRPTAAAPMATEEDGYRLWLRYARLPEPARLALARAARSLFVPGRSLSPKLAAARDELVTGIGGLVGQAPALVKAPQTGGLVLATPTRWPRLKSLGLALEGLGQEGYVLHALRVDGKRVTLIAALGETGLLYGAFAWLRAVQCGADPHALEVREAPLLALRVLNHWDNLDRSVERGYAGASIWDWWKLPHIVDRRYADYGRACASLGINGVSLNNVNARPEILSAPWIAKAAALADVLRTWGMRVYLAVRFSSPRELGGLATADPLNGEVRRWWRDKVDEIYAAIPDFGGFVVKANSEGQPGPQDYGRSHAEGANAIAEALQPRGGTLMWRAFVYASENPQDRARQAYDEFLPLDGAFLPNVILQVKNGPIDYQPREPFHPLFGAMQRTPLMAELMITKEYMGFSTHLAYQGAVFEETLQADTCRPRPGTTVADTLTAPGRAISGMAGVANVGSDRNWCGSHLDQANWYAWGRLAWNPQGSARAIAAEWVRQTFTQDERAVVSMTGMLMNSREAVVDYMTPLGLHHMMDTGHHHGPGPWVDDLARREWNPTYYHRASRDGIGFDRGPRGSNAVAQYAAELATRWSDPATTPERLLLWFHHLGWDHRMRSGRTLWEELVWHYDRGVMQVEGFVRRWRSLRPAIDARRHAEVAEHLAQQLREARWWRDACLAYFGDVAQRPLPPGAAAPDKPLAEYRRIAWLHAPGRG